MEPQTTIPPGWNEPLPAKLARPTYWPAVLAFAASFTLLGPMTSMWLSLVGAALGAVALAGWIGEMMHG